MPESVEKILDINNLYLVAAIAASVFLLVLSFMGCCGALRENHCMLVTYGTLLLAIMLVEVGLGVLAVVYRYKVMTNEVNSACSERKKPSRSKYRFFLGRIIM